MPDRIAILGTGLIGTSLGLSWKNHLDSAPTIVGYDRREEAREMARQRGAVDMLAADPAPAVKDADLVVLATPLPSMLHLLQEIGPALAPDAVVTDVGSVKRPVMAEAAEALPASTLFIGGHPMAGSEQSGPQHARADLFQEAAYVLCPHDDADPKTFTAQHSNFIDLIEATGARVEIMPATHHDRSVAKLSHLPQLLAVALANQAGSDEHAARLAGPGLRDMTRLAASRFDLWKPILIANQGFVLDALSQLSSELQRISNRLAEEDLDALEDTFDQAHGMRAEISRQPSETPEPPIDLYVEAQNRPGELFRITQALYEAELNVMDIEFITVRSSTDGVFRIGFSEESEADAAEQALEAANFATRQPDKN